MPLAGHWLDEAKEDSGALVRRPSYHEHPSSLSLEAQTEGSLGT
jgi:hypothetical protein